LEIFKKTIIEMIALLFVLLLIFIVFLFLNFRNGIILAIILVLTLVYFLNKMFLNREKLQSHFIILSLLIIYLIVISIINSMMYKAASENLNVMKKINIYANIFNLNKIELKMMKSLNYKYVTFYYKSGNENTVELIKTYFNEVESSTNKIFGKSKLVPLKVVIYKNSEELRTHFIVFESADGMFDKNDNSISIIQYNNSISKNDYKGLFFHEYGHYRTSSYLQDNHIPNNIPTWFNEGIAEYIRYGNSANASFKLEKTMNFQKLDAEKSFEESDKAPFNIYLQSYLAVNKMINMKGNQIIRDILDETKKTNFDSAFKLKMGMNIEMFEKIFLK